MVNNDSEVMRSQTMHKIAHFAEMSPWDVTDKDELQSVLLTTIVDLALAMDSRRIRFDRPEEEAAFLGLLTCSLQQYFDGEEVKLGEMTML